MNRLIPTEEQEQILLMDWARITKFKFFDKTEPIANYLCHIPNGGSRHVLEAKKLKRMGVMAGMPDLFLFCSGHKKTASWYGEITKFPRIGLFIEMKRKTNGTLTANQRTMHAKLENCGYKVALCRGFDEAKQAICEYLCIN